MLFRSRMMKRDHTSILHGVKSMREKMRYDVNLSREVERVLSLSQEFEDDRQRLINEQSECARQEADRANKVDANVRNREDESWRLPSYRQILARKGAVVRKTSDGNIISAE